MEQPAQPDDGRVLLACGLTAGEARSTVRFSFGWTTTDADVERSLAAMLRAAQE